MNPPINPNPAISAVQHCTSMVEVRRCVDALDDVLVPLLVQRAAYMRQAARIKQDVQQVRDEARIQTIVNRVCAHAEAEGGEPAVIEAIYRSLMEVCIAYEHREFACLHPTASAADTTTTSEGAAP